MLTFFHKESVGFPSIALFQRKDWSSQANLLGHQGPTSSKCYLGWYNDNATACANLEPETLGNSTECTCKELWYEMSIQIHTQKKVEVNRS